MGSEVRLTDNDILLSTTDTRSYITYANDRFCDVAGFSIDEMRNQPHNLVRHPDMPKPAFENLWQHLKAGESWMGPVKNRCKNGDYYWVNAFVTPISDERGHIEEFQSVRTKPSDKLITRAKSIYSKLNTDAAEKLIRKVNRQTDATLIVAVLLIFAALLSLIDVFLTGFSVTSIAVFLVSITATCLQLGWHRRYIKVVEQAKHTFDNPLMSYLYAGHKDKLSNISLAIKMHDAEIKAIIGRVEDCSLSVNASASEADNASARVTQHLVKQKSETQNIASAMQQMEATIQELADLVNNSATLGAASAEKTQTGQVQVDKTLTHIENLANQLQQASEKVQKLIDNVGQIEFVSNSISDIADQTNLLALNAAIEAARAGDQGRGFSVVADEVRTLAMRTQDSTRQINDMLHQLIQDSDAVSTIMQQSKNLSGLSVESANQAHTVLKDIRTQAEQVAQLNEQTAAAVEEQAMVTKEVSLNAIAITELATFSEKTSESMRCRITALQEKLTEQRKLISQFMQRSRS